MGGGEDKSFRRYSEHGISAQFKRKKAKQIAAAPPNTKKLEAVKTKPVGSGAKRSEIDDLFGRLKGRPMETALPEKAQDVKDSGQNEQDDKKPQSKIQGSKDDIFGRMSGKKRKRTEEGFLIYSEEELGFGKRGGDTPSCPFDCDCCF